MIARRRALAGLAGAVLAGRPAAAESRIEVGYIRWTEPRPAISRLDLRAEDEGLAGARLATQDNATAGRFLGQSHVLIDRPVRSGGDAAAALAGLAAQGVALVLTDAPAPELLALAAAAPAVTLFNIAAPDDALRAQDCRDGIIHVAPSHSMLADALAQYLVWKRWSRWVLAVGAQAADQRLAAAYRRAAARFGARILREIVYDDAGGSRQTDSGLIETQQRMPVFTQRLPEYDVLVAADESEVFAADLPYRTWDARPVAGSAGLRPVDLGSGERFLGRRAAAGPFPAAGRAAHDGARHAGLDRHPHDRRGRTVGRRQRRGDRAGDQGAGLRGRRLQGATAHLA